MLNLLNLTSLLQCCPEIFLSSDENIKFGLEMENQLGFHIVVILLSFTEMTTEQEYLFKRFGGILIPDDSFDF